MLSRDTITVSYTKPDADPLQDPNRNEVESFTDEPVINEIRETFVSNLGQNPAGSVSGDLSTDDHAQRIRPPGPRRASTSPRSRSCS